MVGKVVRPDSHIEDLHWTTLEELAKCLTRDDNYLKVVNESTNWYGDCVFSDNDVAIMRNSQSPGRKLLEKLKEKDRDICTIQDILFNCKLYDAHNILLTNEPMQIVSPVDDVEFNAELGMDLEISVVVKGSPLPTCQWFHNGCSLPGQTQFSISFENFGVENIGTYWCQLTQVINGKLMIQNSGKFVLVLNPAPPVILSHPRDITVHAKQDFMLEVKAVAYPQIKYYSWHKDGCKLEETVMPWIKILDVDEKNAGNYWCVVFNEISGIKSKEAIVTVKRNTLAPTTPDIRLEFPTDTKRMGDWVNLVCTATCCHTVRFYCTLNEKKIEGRDNKASIAENSYLNKYEYHLDYRLTDDDLRTRNTLKFRFVAMSSIGSQSSKEAEITVVRDQREETITARNKFALLIGNCDYSCDYSLTTPSEDMKRLAEKLVRLKFRVMKLDNLGKEEIKAVVQLFAGFVQKDDYVVFYFAGHGFNVHSNDYMIPIDAPLKNMGDRDRTRSGVNQLDTNHCICVSFVVNLLQKHKPALLFSIYDMCRRSFPPQRIAPQEPVIAARNACTLFSTAENYEAYENENSSVLIQTLIPLMEKKISLHALVAEFQRNFFTEAEGKVNDKQFPTAVFDLAKPLYLTNEPNPLCEDFADGGVLKRWEKLASVGGRKEFGMVLDGIAVTVGIKCCQQEISKYRQEVSWIISNCVQVVITLSASGRTFDTSTVDKDGLFLEIQTNMGKQTEEKLEGIIQDPVILTVPAIQDLKDGLLVTVTFKNSKRFELGKYQQNLGWPSLSKEINVRSPYNATTL
ncbi:hypothetical protein Pmani_018858 [Petrolisthes manimaculis]|uniref:Uncharacterized protein n=1 Tax=Petrolisthes manimaculis TaxID=1843537 RepID=A0AAE1PKP9_9EUCA|nr:hypothetical protein Pmani_018858 [Petrolisthes manimaculis]